MRRLHHCLVNIAFCRRFILDRSLDAHPKSAIFSRAVPHLQEGRFAVVTDVGRGMRWTLRQRETGAAKADGEAVWSWRPDAGVKLAWKILPAQATVARKPGHRGERGGNR
jgi:hypothetical protein